MSTPYQPKPEPRRHMPAPAMPLQIEKTPTGWCVGRITGESTVRDFEILADGFGSIDEAVVAAATIEALPRPRKDILTPEQEEFCRRISPQHDTGGRCEKCGCHDVRRYRSMVTDEMLCAQCYLED